MERGGTVLPILLIATQIVAIPSVRTCERFMVDNWIYSDDRKGQIFILIRFFFEMEAKPSSTIWR